MIFYQRNHVRWKSWLVLPAILVLYLMWGDGSASSETIHVGYFENYPCCFTDANGTPRGIFVDLLEAIAAREGWRVEYHLETWAANVKKLERAELDLLLSMAISEERLQNYTFSAVTIVNNWAQMFVPAESQIQSLLDLQGKRIAALKNGYHTDSSEGIIAIDEKFGLDCQFLFEDGYAEIIEALKQKRADAGVLTRLAGRTFEQEPGVKKTGIVFAPTDVRFALPKQGAKTAALVKKLDAHLVAMQNENTSVFYAILETYLGEQPHVVIRFPHWLLLFLPALGVGSLLLLTIALFFRWQLRRRTYELRQQLQKRKQTEEALRQSEERLAKVLEILPVGVWISDRKGVILHGNHAGQTIWTGARYVGPEQFHEYKAWWLATGKRITPKEWGVTRAITQGEVSHEEEIEIECFDGTHKIILNWAAPIFGPDQQIEGAVAVNQDITERKRAEKELQTRVEEQEWLLRSMINAFVIFQSVLDEHGQFISYRFEYINDAYERTTGVKLADVRGKTVHEVWPETEAAWVENYGAVAMTGVPREFNLYHAPTGKLYHCYVYRPWNTTARFCVVFEDITERKRAEDLLRESEQRFRQIYEHMHVGVAQISLDLRVERANHAYCSMLGYSEEELCGKHLRDFTHPDILEENLKKQMQLARGEIDHYQLEKSFIHKDGHTIYGILDANLIRDAAGNPSYFLGSVVDITERKRAEKAVRESEERLRSIFANIPIGMFQSTSKGKFLYVNPAIPDMLKYASPEELIHKVNQTSIAEALYEDPARRPVLVQQVEQSGGQWKLFENRYRCKDGSIIDALLSFCERPDPLTGQRFLYGFVQDITERKRIEEALRESEENFRRIFEMSLSMICIADIHTATFLKINPAFTSILGYHEEELLKRPFFDFIHPEDLAATRDIVEKELQQGKKVLHFINRYRCKDRTYRWLDWMSHPNPEKGLTYAIAHDITDLKQAEAEIRRLNAVLEQRVAERTAQLEAVNQELERFAYVTSHDLKAPLRGISQLASWLAADYSHVLDDDGQKLCMLLKGRVKRMDALIDGILQYSRIGRISNASEPTALAEIIVDVLEMLNPPATLQIFIPPDLPIVKGDKIRLTQVFQNLLSNALNFIDKPDGRITIGCNDGGAFWTFSVSDNGPGISSQYHERIFQIFQTLHARDKYESTGIGLAIVKKIVELHGGTIWVESAPGQGSAFFFTLPKTSDQDWCTGSSTQE